MTLAELMRLSVVGLLAYTVCAAAVGCSPAAASVETQVDAQDKAKPNSEITRLNYIQTALIESYPSLVEAAGPSSVRMADGTIFQIDDGIEHKTITQLYEQPDLEDMFHWPYPSGPQLQSPSGDPGRIRSQEFFDRIYGNCENNEVASRLVTVRWFTGASVRFNSANGAAEALQRVSDELGSSAAGRHPAAQAIAGTFNCRRIAGTQRRSMHAYGTAIDLSTTHGEYWQWDNERDASLVWRNRFPYEVAQVFEKHGFIWGARWNHYDTFHFEYRPELIAFQKLEAGR